MKIVACIPNSTKHYTESGISYIAVYDMEDKTMQHYAIDLVDSDNVSIPYITGECIVLNKRLLDLYCDDIISYDLETQYWINGESIPDTFFNFDKYFRFYRRGDYYRYVPFTKYKKSFEQLINYLNEKLNILEIGETSIFYRTYVYSNLKCIEKNGLYINNEKFKNKFNKEYVNDIVKTFYNIHTTTGRPSNTYDGINYSALSKKDGVRECFESRYEEGYLIEFDFDSYHLRLIGKMIGYNFKDSTSIHTDFARLYFNKDEISEQDYENSKKLTFTMLYKDDESMLQQYNIDFFNKVKSFKEELWIKSQSQGCIESKLSKRKLYISKDSSPSKLFNYYLQMIETEFSMLFIYDICQILKNRLSKIILYTYDSILIDFNPADGDSLINDIKNKLITTKISKGKNYNEMRRVS